MEPMDSLIVYTYYNLRGVTQALDLSLHVFFFPWHLWYAEMTSQHLRDLN